MKQGAHRCLNSSDPAFGYVPELDGIRAISILFVLALHVSYGRLGGGFLGVDIFFVLSGYLITALLIAERRTTGWINLGSFYLRRVFRILPPIACSLLLAFLLWDVTSSPLGGFPRAAVTVALFVSNFVSADNMGILGHTWSLSIEEQFYLIWPLTLVLCARYSWGFAFLVPLAGVTCGLAYRYLYISAGGDLLALYTMSAARMDSILVGCLLAIGRQRFSAALSPLRPNLLLYFVSVVLILFLALATRSKMLSLYWSFSLFAIISAVFILLSSIADRNHPVRKFLRLAPLKYIGSISYGLYIYHYPVFAWLEQFRIAGSVKNYIVVSCCKLALSVAVAALSWRFIERPMIGMRKMLSN